MDPLELLRLPLGPEAESLWFVLVNPKFEAPTAKMRAALPPTVPFKAMINNCCQGGSLVGVQDLGQGRCVCMYA